MRTTPHHTATMCHRPRTRTPAGHRLRWAPPPDGNYADAPPDGDYGNAPPGRDYGNAANAPPDGDYANGPPERDYGDAPPPEGY